ncbi:non-ribosomal peptide synthetase module [Paenibacillus sp. Z6-24]
MAQRLATEYIKASLQLSKDQMSQFIHYAEDPHVHHRVKVLDNGSQEVVFGTRNGEEVHLPFDLKEGSYVCELSFRLVNPHLTSMIRKLFVAFQGSGIVNRIYKGFTMIYDYDQGVVQRITEHTAEGEKVIYRQKNASLELTARLQSTSIETDIELVRRIVDQLLDQRNASPGPHEEIDRELQIQAKRLFSLEA